MTGASSVPAVLKPYADRIRRKGACLVWTGSFNSGGCPYAQDGRRVYIRRLVCRDAKRTGIICGRHDCVSPEHVVDRDSQAWFERHLCQEGECLVWTASSRGSDGYGQFRLRGRMELAHRAAWLLAGRELPDGQVLRHSCDNPACCRLDHLELGTHADNMRDMVERGRQARPKGAANSQAKLSDAIVREIRDLYAAGGITQAELGRRYGVSREVVSKIVRGKRWKHLGDSIATNGITQHRARGAA